MRAFLESSAKKYEKVTAQKEADIKKNVEHMAELERIGRKEGSRGKRLAEEEAARKAIEEKAKHMAELKELKKKRRQQRQKD